VASGTKHTAHCTLAIQPHSSQSQRLCRMHVHISRTNSLSNIVVNDKLFVDFQDLRIFRTPVGKALFDVEEKEEKLEIERKEFFHTTVAKLLYLTKRVIPDIFLAVSLMSTRVKEHNELGRKLLHLLDYLKWTKDHKLYM
jgi:hypothetical protein